MQNSQETWRSFLGKIIQEAPEKQRIATVVGVKDSTVQRWVDGNSQPRLHNLKHLLSALPEHRDLLKTLMQKEFPKIATVEENDAPLQIPQAFYNQVLNAHTFTAIPLQFWSITNLIAQQVSGQLDPNREGMLVMLMRCMPPRGKEEKIHSFRGYFALNTLPGPASPYSNQLPSFFGLESLAGTAANEGRILALNDLQAHSSQFPTNIRSGFGSMLACPITRDDHIAGCLVLISPLPGFFSLPSRVALVQQYTNLMTLAFESHEFYGRSNLELYEMPAFDEQAVYFKDFKKRQLREMLLAAIDDRSLTLLQAEDIVWRQLEEEILDAVLRPSPTVSSEIEQTVNDYAVSAAFSGKAKFIDASE